MLIWLTMMGVPYAYGKDSHLSINILVKNFQPKNEKILKIVIDILILTLSVSVMIVGGIMATSNAAGQLSPAMQIPMQIYYVCVPISGILMVIYGVIKIVDHIKEIKNA